VQASPQRTTVLRLIDAASIHGRSATRWAVASGRWQRPHRSVVVTHSGTVSRVELMHVAVLAGPPGTLLAGLTAAELGGLRGFCSDDIHVLIPHRSRMFTIPGVVVRRSTLLTPEQGIGDPARTRLERSVVDASRWAASPRLARAIVLATVQQRLTTPARLQNALVARRRAPGIGLVRQSIIDAAGGVESLPERDFVQLLKRAGLPLPAHQTKVRTASGRYRLDASFEPWGVDVEIDGAHHRDVLQSAADLDRQNDLVIEGRRLLRFDSFQVRHESGAVAAVIRRALR
jgi:very-short-patch-repair endonuclease